MAVQDQNVTIDMQIGFAMGSNPSGLPFNYTEPITTTAQFCDSHTVAIDPSETDFEVDLASIFAGIADPIAFGMQDLVESPGVPVEWGLAVGGTRFPMAGTGAMCIRVSGELPTLYIDNPSATDMAVLKFTVMGD